MDDWTIGRLDDWTIGRLHDSIEKLQSYLKVREELHFAPINLESDRQICLESRIDSFVCSFGSADNFYKDGGPGFYFDWLRNKIEKNSLVSGTR